MKTIRREGVVCRMNKYNLLIQEALEQYGITNFTANIIRHNENIAVKIKNHNDNMQYLLRIHDPITKNLYGVQHTLEGLNAEILLLNELNKKTEISLQRPIKNKKESYVSTVIDCKENATFLCTLLTWIDGTEFTGTEENAEKIAYDLGVLLAKLHNFSCSWKISSPYIRPIYNIEKYTHLINSLAYGIKEELFTREQYEIVLETFESIKAIFNSTMKTKNNWGIIHADLQGGNIIVNDNLVSPIDFCFSGYGYFLFDLGITLCSVKRNLRKKILEGYTTIRNINEEDYNLISACFILSILGAFGFSINNAQRYEWIKRRMPYVTSEYCLKFLNGESFILEID